MPKNVCDSCPGCKRRCPSCCPRCKYGKKYFAGKAPNSDRPGCAKNLSHDSPAWQLLKVSKRMKKALRKEKISPEQLFERFSPDELQIFSELLTKLRTSLEEIK